MTTCPACNYTRKPTDDAPEWACPQCLKVYAKSSPSSSDPVDTSLTSACKTDISWRCSQCGAEFCAEGVEPIKFVASYLPDKVPIGMCPQCRGLCVNVDYADKLATEQLPRHKAARKTARTVLVMGIAFIPFITFFTIFMRSMPEIGFVVFLGLYAIGAVVHWQGHLDRWIGGGSIFPELNNEYQLLPPKNRPVLTAFLFLLAATSLLILFLRAHQYSIRF